MELLHSLRCYGSLVFSQTKQIPRLWYAKEGAYFFDKRKYYLVYYNDLYKKCLDIYEAIDYLFTITKESPLFACDLDEGVAIGCDRE